MTINMPLGTTIKVNFSKSLDLKDGVVTCPFDIQPGGAGSICTSFGGRLID